VTNAGTRGEIVAQLLADQEALVRDFLGAIDRDIPAYAGLDARQSNEVHAIGAWTLRRFLELWIHDGLPNEDDARRFRSVGAARARDGRPLPAVLRAYRMIGSRIIDHIVERYGETLCVQDVAALSHVYLAVLDVISEAIYDGYDVSSRLLTTDREASLRALLADLVRGHQTHEGSLKARLRELDARLPSTFALLIAVPGDAMSHDDAALHLSTAAQTEISTPISSPDLVSTIHTRVDTATVVLTTISDSNRLRTRLRRLTLPSALLTGVTSRDAPRRYRLAVHALQRYRAYQPVALEQGDLETVAVTTGHPDADAALMGETVLDMLGDEELRTLNAVVNLGSDAAAAEALQLHPQTIRYRLRGISQTTGRDPRNPWDRFVLQAALVGRSAGLPADMQAGNTSPAARTTRHTHDERW
jgi:hypothetical protein